MVIYLKKTLLTFLFIIFSFQSIYSYSITNNVGISINYFGVNDINSPTSMVGASGPIPIGGNVELSGNNFYWSTDESFAYFSTDTDSVGGNINSKDYYVNMIPFNWLTTTSCNPSVSGTTIWGNFQTGTQINNYITFLNANKLQVLQNNYYMTAKIEYKLFKDGVERNDYTKEILTGYKIKPSPGVALTTTEINYISDAEIQAYADLHNDYGSYSVRIDVIPTDLKCDFNNDGYPEYSTIDSSAKTIKTYNAKKSGICGTENNVCTYGTLQDITDTSSQYYWKCQGDTGTTATSCSAIIPTCNINDKPLDTSNSNTCTNGQVGQSSTTTYSCVGTVWTATATYLGTCYTPCSPTYTYSCNGAGNVIQINSCTLDSSQVNPPCSAGCSNGVCNPDADHDGFADIDTNSDGKPEDWCPGITSLTGYENTYNGCPYEYSIKPGTTCQQVSNDCHGFWPFEICYSAQTSFNEATNTFNCRSEYPGEDYFAKANSNNCNLFNLEGNPDCGDLNLMSLSGSGRYVCVNSNSGDDKVVGYCDLRFNGNINLGCNVNGIFIADGQIKDIYKYKKVLRVLEDDNIFFEGKKRVSCNNGNSIINGNAAITTLLPEFRFVGAKILSGPEYDNLIRDTITGELKVNDTITIGKLSCDSTEDICSLKVNSTTAIDINLTTIPQTRTAAIKIIKDGTNIRNDTIDISLIAMQAHKIQRFTNSTNAENFIAKSYDVMTKFDITKNLTYNPVTNKTTVRILMNNIPESDKKNLTIYMLVDKEIANSLEDISNINQSNKSQFFVVDKDPIIGWYFNESGSDEEVGYEVPGESEGGTVIITQTPILYNEGELIINYRETDCSAEELTLFELDNLIDSKVYAPASSQLYKVCLTHLNSNVNLALGSGVQSIDVMSYTNTQNASSNPIELTNKITLSTDNSSLYWDVRVQKENPSGNYSCIGSLDLVNQSSLFGDCGYNEDARVWIHLGEDYNAPETTLSYPSLAHTLKVTLTAFEPTWESGVKNLSYRIILEDNESFTTVEDDTVSFIVTCPNDWNCKKTVEYYAYDKAGNKEETKSRELLLIDKGSACQADCTAKPSPNRYLKECTNLNSCEFYQFNEFGINDGGDYVANQCDYLAIGSWATYNETHEILCPKGPFRESKFTTTRVNVIDESNCENILKTPYPVIFDGENIIMNVISCINYEE